MNGLRPAIYGINTGCMSSMIAPPHSLDCYACKTPFTYCSSERKAEWLLMNKKSSILRHKFIRSKNMTKTESPSNEINEITCESCSASIKLDDLDSNRCSDCGLEYDGDGELITDGVECDGCQSLVYLTSQERNV